MCHSDRRRCQGTVAGCATPGRECEKLLILWRADMHQHWKRMIYVMCVCLLSMLPFKLWYSQYKKKRDGAGCDTTAFTSTCRQSFTLRHTSFRGKRGFNILMDKKSWVKAITFFQQWPPQAPQSCWMRFSQSCFRTTPCLCLFIDWKKVYPATSSFWQ